MGNQQSAPSEHATSIRSKSSRRARISTDEPSSRASRAVSFYQTPPGSFDTPRMSTFSPLAESPVTTESGTPSRPSSAYSQQPLSTPPESKPEEARPEFEGKETAMKQRRSFRQGVYSIVNAKSGTALDLSGADEKSIIGFPLHSGKNQQWNFLPSGDGYTIKSVSSGLYLTVEDSVVEGALLVASPYPVSWKVEDISDEVTSIRILWPSEKYAYDLADFGSTAPGTKIQMAPSRPDELCQRWDLIEREASPVDTSPERSPHMVQSPPLETVYVTEDKDSIVTTRTTTTSTVTTVTSVTKTPKGQT